MQLSVTKTFLKLTLNINLNKQRKAFSYMQQNYNQLNWNLLVTDGVKMKCFLTWRMLIWTFPCTNIWNFFASVKSENGKQSKHFTRKPIKVCSARSVTHSREKLTNTLSTQEAWAALVAELLAFHFHTRTNRLQQPHCLQSGASPRGRWSWQVFWVTPTHISKNWPGSSLSVQLADWHHTRASLQFHYGRECAREMKKTSGKGQVLSAASSP